MVMDASKTYDAHQTSSSELQPSIVELMHTHSKDTTTVSFTHNKAYDLPTETSLTALIFIS